MSLDLSREDYWSATTRSTIRERCKFMLNNELLSDVKFRVVRDSEGGSKSMNKIPAHKFLLAISSPVFYAMFYGELAEKNDFIDVSDCDHKSLLELFRFVYSDEVNLTADNVMQVLYFCSEFLRKNLDASNVFHVLPEAQKYQEKDLENHCWEVIDMQTDEAVKSDGFVIIEKSMLEELVERDSLNVREVELFKAVDCWATKECEKQGLAAEGSVKRKILGEQIVKAIRFPVMNQQEFADVVLDCDILTKKESFDLVKYFSSVLKFPMGFSEATRPGSLQRIKMSRFEGIEEYGGFTISWRNSIVVSVDKTIQLHEVRLFGNENNEYSVTFTVSDSDGVALATKTGMFMSQRVQSEGEVYQGFDVALKPPISLQAGIQYSLHASVRGPASQCGSRVRFPRVEHAGVTFFFANKAGEGEGYGTTFLAGHFSELVFAVN